LTCGLTCGLNLGGGFVSFDAIDVIITKRDGGELSHGQIDWVPRIVLIVSPHVPFVHLGSLFEHGSRYANNVAAITPARRTNRLQPAHIATGTVSRPNRSESAWVAVSLAPNPSIQKWSSA